jgi:processive 1,2-diacylglycerol beta-glucosyltransferase
MAGSKIKILIVTAPVGNGHNAASHAIKSCLETLYDAEVKIYDIFLTSSKFRAWVFGKFYFWMAKYFIEKLNKDYLKIKNRDITKAKSSAPPAILVGGKVIPMLEDAIKDFAPAAVICTHIGGMIAASELKQEQKFDVPVFSVVTDYEIPPYIEYCHSIDYFITPSGDFDQQLFRYGVKQEQIFSYGIPADSKFSVHLDKAEIRRKLGIREDLFTITITNGFVGLGDTVDLIQKLFTALPNKIQIISVCGKNRKLKRQIDNLVKNGQINLLNYGFIDSIDKIMSASDLLIGKLGGLTTTEAINKRLCVLAVTNLPMQEYDNMLYLTAYGACGYIKNPAAAGAIVTDYVEKPEILSCMRQNIEKIRKPDAAINIAKAVMQAVQKPWA